MPEQLNPVVAENLASGAMHYLPLTPGNKVICTKRQLQECLVTLAQEAFAMGFLSGQKEHFSSSVPCSVTQRPEWMDISLDDLNALARHGFRLRPVVVRSLVAAGYRELGDLCWVSDYELRKLFYIGGKMARQIRDVIRQLQKPLEPARVGNRGAEERVRSAPSPKQSA